MQVIDLSNESAIQLLYDVASFFKDDKELYNLCLNRIKFLLEREIGKIVVLNIEELKEMESSKEILDRWETDAKKRGIIFKKE